MQTKQYWTLTISEDKNNVTSLVEVHMDCSEWWRSCAVQSQVQEYPVTSCHSKMTWVMWKVWLIKKWYNQNRNISPQLSVRCWWIVTRLVKKCGVYFTAWQKILFYTVKLQFVILNQAWTVNLHVGMNI